MTPWPSRLALYVGGSKQTRWWPQGPSKKHSFCSRNPPEANPMLENKRFLMPFGPWGSPKNAKNPIGMNRLSFPDFSINHQGLVHNPDMEAVPNGSPGKMLIIPSNLVENITSLILSKYVCETLKPTKSIDSTKYLNLGFAFPKHRKKY